MIYRELTSVLKESAKSFPVVAILGPRQSGKTTLARYVFKNYNYVSLEELDAREFARTNPHEFLSTHVQNGVILDEIQRAPDLLSYIQTYVDKNKKKGQFILTGSQNFLLNEMISQTLAGRIAIETLLPLSITELEQAKKLKSTISQTIISGFYPSIFDPNVSPTKWYSNYLRTYIERDVRLIKNVTDLSAFQRFIKLCAGRIGQILNLSSLANDCGISPNTVKEWLSLLEASYIIFLLQPYYKNFSKRLIKSPKLYFYDTGVACNLLGISTAEQYSVHYLKGGLFESMVISELIKQQYNYGTVPQTYFWRDQSGHEIDCIIEKGIETLAIEIKAGMTITSSFFDSLQYWQKLAKIPSSNNFLIYGGTEQQYRKYGNVYGWKNFSQIVKKST